MPLCIFNHSCADSTAFFVLINLSPGILLGFFQIAFKSKAPANGMISCLS